MRKNHEKSCLEYRMKCATCSQFIPRKSFESHEKTCTGAPGENGTEAVKNTEGRAETYVEANNSAMLDTSKLTESNTTQAISSSNTSVNVNINGQSSLKVADGSVGGDSGEKTLNSSINNNKFKTETEKDRDVSLVHFLHPKLSKSTDYRPIFDLNRN